MQTVNETEPPSVPKQQASQPSAPAVPIVSGATETVAKPTPTPAAAKTIAAKAPATKTATPVKAKAPAAAPKPVDLQSETEVEDQEQPTGVYAVSVEDSAEALEMPDLLDIVKSDSHANGNCFKIKLYSPTCLICTHLISGGDDDEVFVEERQAISKCHISNGNRYCPAGTFNIEFIGAKVKWNRRIEKVLALPEKTPERLNATFSLVEKIRMLEDANLQMELLAKLGF